MRLTWACNSIRAIKKPLLFSGTNTKSRTWQFLATRKIKRSTRAGFSISLQLPRDCLNFLWHHYIPIGSWVGYNIYMQSILVFSVWLLWIFGFHDICFHWSPIRRVFTASYRQKSMLQASESIQPSIIKNVPGIHESGLRVILNRLGWALIHICVS